METSHATNLKQAESEENSNIQRKKKTKDRTPTVKMEGSTYSSGGRNRPRMISSTNMMMMMMMMMMLLLRYWMEDYDGTLTTDLIRT
jgi:hypothetical protein